MHSKTNTKELHFVHTLRDILKSCKGDTVSFGEIMKNLKDEGLIFLIAVISFPTAFPIPTPPGFTTLFGIPLCILIVQMLCALDSKLMPKWLSQKLSKHSSPWLPNWVSKKEIKVSTFKAFIDKAEPILNKLSILLRPRKKYFTTVATEKIVSIIALVCAVAITLPILFGNAIPSAGIFIMYVGLLYKDGLAVLIGIIVSIIGIAIASIVVFVFIFFGKQVLDQALSYITQLIF